MERHAVRKLLEQVRAQELDLDTAVARLQGLEIADLGHSKLDLARELRSGLPEVVYAEGKAGNELLDIIGAAAEKQKRLLVTRFRSDHLPLLQEAEIETLQIFPRARAAVVGALQPPDPPKSSIAVVTAGTSDAAVAEEVAVSAKYFGLGVRHIPDVGVAGLPRLLQALPELRQAEVIIVLAGMEGALPSVIGGLVDVPVIAVPTSVGYGANFEGIAALLGMLVSCSPGVTVVNIDNGFGAALAAVKMIRHFHRLTSD